MSEINFFWDPLSDNILQERDETGAVTAEYTAEPGLYGSVISQNRGGVESQFHYDAQGSTLAVTDDNQNVTDTFAYTAFGEVTERTGATDVPFQYIGQKGYYRDGLTGQIMARRRPYEPEGARWLSVDPLQWTLFSEWYVYSANSPVLDIDPSGRRLIAPGRSGPTQVANSMDDVWNVITATLGYKPSSDGNCACVTLRWALFWPSMRDILWRGYSKEERADIYQGCIGFCRVRARELGCSPGGLPESIPGALCSLTPVAPGSIKCGPGEKPFSAIKQGIWDLGAPPTPNAAGNVRCNSVTGKTDKRPFFNYWSYVDGYWIYMNHCKFVRDQSTNEYRCATTSDPDDAPENPHAPQKMTICKCKSPPVLKWAAIPATIYISACCPCPGGAAGGGASVPTIE